MERRSTWPYLHIWRSVNAPVKLYLFALISTCQTYLLCVLFTAWPLHPACCYYQRHLHGLLLQRRKDLPSTFPQESLWEWILQNSWLVRLTLRHYHFYNLSYRQLHVVLRKNYLLRCRYSNRVTGIYELSLCKMSDTGSPGEQPKKIIKINVLNQLLVYACYDFFLRTLSSLVFFFSLSRDATKEEEGPGHISGLCAWRGEPGWVEAQRRQSHTGAPMGAGENGAAAWGWSLQSYWTVSLPHNTLRRKKRPYHGNLFCV